MSPPEPHATAAPAPSPPSVTGGRPSGGPAGSGTPATGPRDGSPWQDGIPSWFAVPGALGYAALFAVMSSNFLNPDFYTYGLAARRWLEGHRLYGLAWENKPPLGIVPYIVPTLFGRDITVASQLTLAVLLLVTAYLTARLMRPYGNAARLAAALTVLFWPLQRHDFFWFSTEHITNLPVILVLLTALRLSDDERPATGLAWLHGAMMVAALMIRQNTAVYGLVSLIALLSGRREWSDRLRLLGGMVGGALLSTLAVAGLVLVACDPEGFWDVTFEAPRRFNGFGGLRDIAGLVWLFRNDAMLLLAVAATVAVALGRRSIVPLVWLGLALFVVLSPKRMNEHYWAQLMPVAAIWQGVAVGAVAAVARDPHVRRVAWGLGLGLLAYLAGNGALTVGGVRFRKPLGPLRAVVAAVDRDASPQDRLFAFGRGDAYIISTTRLAPADHFHWAEHLRDNIHPALTDPVDEVVARLRANPPDVLAIDADDLEATRAFARGEIENDPYLYGLLSDWIDHPDVFRPTEQVGTWTIYHKVKAPAAVPAPAPARRGPDSPSLAPAN